MACENNTGLLDAREHGCCKSSLFKKCLQGLPQIFPESRSALFMDSRISEHGELLGCGSEEKQNAVPMFCLSHAQSLEGSLGQLQSLAAGGRGLSRNEHADFTRGFRFRRGNRGDDSIVIELVNEMFVLHNKMHG